MSQPQLNETRCAEILIEGQNLVMGPYVVANEATSPRERDWR